MASAEPGTAGAAAASGNPSPSILVLYGSQTGCSREVALTIARAVSRCRYDTQLVSMEHFDMRRLPGIHRLVAVCSTAGQGQVPDSMRRFWSVLLRRDLPAGFLGHLEATVFGLGDSGYPLYNAAARRLSVRLGQLGARSLLPPGLGDDRHPNGVDGTLIPWLEQLCGVLIKQHPQSVSTGTPITPFPEDYLFPVRLHVATATASEPDEGGRLSNAGAAVEDDPQARAAAEDEQDPVRLVTAGFPSPESILALPAFRSGLELYRPFPVRVRANRRMTAADHFQNVCHVVLGLEKEKAAASAHEGLPLPAWHPGDVLVVHPRNPAAAVQSLYARFGLRPDTELILSPASAPSGGSAGAQGDVPLLVLDDDEGVDGSATGAAGAALSPSPSPLPPPLQGGAAASTRIPSRISARDLFEVYLGVLGPPSRYFFRILARFAEDEMERERIAELASPAFHDDFERYCTRELRNFVEVLEDFPSVRLPLDLFVDLVPRLQPRQFSLASSRLAHPDELHLCVAVLDRRTPFRRRKLGVCSSWLADLPPGAWVPVWVKPGSLRLPEPPLATPVICVGPGTGIAPFRAAWQHLQHLRDAAEAEASSAPDGAPSDGFGGGVYLWCGFRNRRGDFLFGEEMLSNAGSAGGIIRQLETAFSRDPPAAEGEKRPSGGKLYVQHRLVQRGELVWSLLARGAYLLVAGNAGSGMTSAVQDAIVQIAQEHGGLEEGHARKLVDRMQKSGIYQVEAW